jgi:hypothetical protein
MHTTKLAVVVFWYGFGFALGERHDTKFSPSVLLQFFALHLIPYLNFNGYKLFNYDYTLTIIVSIAS